MHRVLIGQGVAAAVVALIAGFWGALGAYSALLGGLICLVPNALFARRVFMRRGATQARLVVRDFYVGEAMKIGLTAVLFGLAFGWVEPLSAPALFAGFITVQAAGWISALRLSTG
ncbi:MAG: ATP synthase subunit I [Pseudomonadota bacterium]|nr:ATP synthase subunit I [Pseudomonadota bacterium]